jgi:serine/threonine protein kinase
MAENEQNASKRRTKVAQDDALRKYRKEVKVGEGTYGVVYRAVHIETGQTVALKKIRLEAEDEVDSLPPLCHLAIPFPFPFSSSHHFLFPSLF